MPSNNYSPGSRSIHRAYLSNYFVSKTSFDLEQLFFWRKAKEKHLKEIVFVTGLARSGTTALFNALFSTEGFASLTYSDMPFLLMPNLGKHFFKAPPSEFAERSHQDGILINNKSPEAFDEYFWKVFLADKYIHADRLTFHAIDKSAIENYKKYIQLITYNSHKDSYLSKNNNNILRITSLLNGFPTAKFIALYREPLTHAHSLLKQHIHFSNLQLQDHFMVEYFNYLGHHEFGLNHKPFYFNEESKVAANPLDLNYWLTNWKDYYSYLLTNLSPRFSLIAFEDLCESPDKIAQYLNKTLVLDQPVAIKNKHYPKSYPTIEFDKNIYNDCMEIYRELNSKKGYQD